MRKSAETQAGLNSTPKTLDQMWNDHIYCKCNKCSKELIMGGEHANSVVIAGNIYLGKNGGLVGDNFAVKDPQELTIGLNDGIVPVLRHMTVLCADCFCEVIHPILMHSTRWVYE